MKNLLLITCYLLLLAATAAAQIPLRWETDVARPAPAQFTRYDGDAITFEPAWLAYGAPLATNGMTFTLYWQTNGMGAVWFTNTAGNAFQWLPEYYTGAPQYTFFIGADGHNYQANGVLRVLPSPGRKPNTLTPPIPYLDFLATPCLNAPWLLPGALGGYATEEHVAGAVAAAVRKGEANGVGDAFELWGRGFTHKRHRFLVGEEINAQAAKGTTVLLDGAAGAVVLADYSPEAPVMSELTVAPDGTFALQWGEAPKAVFALPRDGAGGTLATEGHVAAAAAGKVSSATVAAIWTGTQGEYDAIAVPDPQTLYIILEDGP
ncbi:MAG: hypothetical protein FWH21_00115 [Kiritimatiellaeota bacterium]|nr:hypothetical protein [Kiritimatiellota bacterium]